MLHKIKQKLNFGPRNQLNRERWLERKLQEIAPGSRILDAGAGELRYKKFCTHLDYVSQDFGQYDGAGNGEGLQEQVWDNSKLDLVCDIAAIPVANASFDAAMCIEVFEHIPEPIKALEELGRIIKPGGHLILTAPMNSLVHFAPHYYYSGYSKYWYEKFLAQAGFEIVELSPNGNYFELVAQEVARLISAARGYSRIGRLGLACVYAASVPMILALMALTKKNRRSEELACFGYHVLAVKTDKGSV